MAGKTAGERAQAMRRSPFAGLGREHAAPSPAGGAAPGAAGRTDAPGLEAAAIWPRRIALLRGPETALAAAAESLRLPLPPIHGSELATPVHLLRFAPDILQVSSPETEAGEEDDPASAPSLQAAMDAAVARSPKSGAKGGAKAKGGPKSWEGAALALDLSEERLILALGGPAFGDIWRQFCPLDIDEPAFPPGRATQTLAAGVPVGLLRVPEGAHTASLLPWRVFLRRSYLAWFTGLLADAARPRGFRLDFD